jgi:hypothetical protein
MATLTRHNNFEDLKNNPALKVKTAFQDKKKAVVEIEAFIRLLKPLKDRNQIVNGK